MAAPGTAVMIHGAFAGPWCFDGFRDRFEARGWRVETPALRHHDAPPTGAALAALATTGLRDYADDLASLLAGLDGPVVLVGHSLGGLLAQMLAARGLARAVVLLTPAAPWGILPSTDDEVAAAKGLMAAGAFWTQSLTPAFEIAAENSLNCLPPERQRQVFERFQAESGRALLESMFWMFDASAASHINAVNVDCPLLCIAGGRDRVISAPTVGRIAEKYADLATTIEYDDRGHMLLLEDGWEEVADDSLDWLDEALRRSAAG